MKTNFIRRLPGLFSIFTVVFFTGCNGIGSFGIQRITADELGISLPIPPGWKIDGHNPRLCYKDTSTGIIIDEPMNGKNFEDAVDTICYDFRGQVKSKKSMEISGYKAILALIEYPHLGTTNLKLFVLKNNRLIEASFALVSSEFKKQESAIRKCLESIAIE